MKKLKFLSALVMSIMMLLTLCIPAFAADPTYTITILPNSADKASHTYEAYQIFKGDLDEGTLSNIVWGSGLDASKTVGEKTIYQALAALDAVFTDADTAEEIADALSSAELDAGKIPEIAKIFGAYLTDVHIDSSKSGSNVSINDLPVGYYLIKDADAPLDNDDAAYTSYLLRLTKNISVSVKSSIPSMDKNIITADDTASKAADYSIGDDVPFQLTATIPDMANYNSYYFVFSDTMSEGLTFNNDAAITIIDADNKVLKTLTKDEDYLVVTDDETNSVRIILTNFVQYNTKDYIGKTVKVAYTARLNENAQPGGVPDTKNSAQLIFSNNPNFTYDNDNDDEPDPGEPIGKTPFSETMVYTTGIKVVKVDAENLKRLNGAEFTIEGDGVKDVIRITYGFKEDTDGTYYMLTDGSYTEEAPTPATEDKYDSTTILYKLTKDVASVGDANYIKGVGSVGDDGIVSFTGLSSGIYTITESKTPYGYNTIGSFKIEITAEPSETECKWDAKVIDDGGMTIDELKEDDTALFTVIVKNSKGTLLPSTGGIGTKIFYIVGSVLVLVAVVLLVTRKRVNAKEK